MEAWTTASEVRMEQKMKVRNPKGKELADSEQAVGIWLTQSAIVIYKNPGTILKSVELSSLVENVVSHVELRDVILLFHGFCLNVYMSCL